MLFLIRLEQLGICTLLGWYRRGQDSPAVSLCGGDQGLCMHGQTIADLDLACLGLRWTTSTQPLYGSADGFHTIVQGMVTPEARRAPPPSLPPAFIVADGRLGV